MATALKQLRSNRTPGEDGLSPEFYKVFFKILSDPLFQMIEETYFRKLLSVTLRTGIINSIPKSNKDNRYLKNLRPLTLLNTDYKIIEKMIANRIEPALDYIIHQDQHGFMRNRNIAINIRKMFDLIQFMECTQTPATILSLDFEKCFDKIENTAIIGAMEFFGFNQFLIDWVSIIYKEFKARVQNNGNLSQLLNIEKGVHQGGCTSTVLFLLCAEVLAMEIWSNSEIKGIPVDDIINILSQFADDMDIYQLFDQKSFDQTFYCLENFCRVSGFTINYNKMQVYRIGSIKNSSAELISQWAIAWTNDPINVLGILVSHQEKQVTGLSYAPLIEKTRSILAMWIQQSLSLLGKVWVVNTLIASLFVYKMMVLPAIPEEVVIVVEKLIEAFIWNNHKPKIPLKTLQASKELGGLNLVNLRCKDAALKTSWVSLLEQNQAYATVVHELIQPELKQLLWHCNLRQEDVAYVVHKNCNQFWVDVLKAWV